MNFRFARRKFKIKSMKRFADISCEAKSFVRGKPSYVRAALTTEFRAHFVLPKLAKNCALIFAIFASRIFKRAFQFVPTCI